MLLETLCWSVLGGILAVAGPAATLWFAASSHVHETLAVAARGIPVAVACAALPSVATTWNDFAPGTDVSMALPFANDPAQEATPEPASAQLKDASTGWFLRSVELLARRRD